MLAFATESRVQIPHRWRPRAYQLRAWRFLEGGGSRALLVWHRRSGKDNLCLNFTATQMFDRPGVYWHMLPEKEQARKVVWNGMDKEGVRFIDQAFPIALRTGTFENEMRINFRCADGKSTSIWQLCGSDNYNALVGGNPRGVVFSEYALSNPAAWNFIRPILAENGGWAIFNMTPRGMNHGEDLYRMAKANPAWFCERLTVDDTDVISRERIQEERDSGMPEEMIDQEYYCDFEAANIGSYYGKNLRKAQDEGRVGDFPHLEDRLVHTGWDIGRTDDTSIWFWQVLRNRIRFIDFHTSSGGDVPFYADLLRERQRMYGYRYADPPLYLPHDGKAETMASPRSVQRQFADEGFRSLVLKVRDVQEGIQEVRATIDQAEFNEPTTGEGVNALKLYQRHWNEERKCFEDRPVHDWTSHPADAMRTVARVWREEQMPKAPEPPKWPVGAQPTATFNDALKMVRQRRIGANG